MNSMPGKSVIKNIKLHVVTDIKLKYYTIKVNEKFVCVVLTAFPRDKNEYVIFDYFPTHNYP